MDDVIRMISNACKIPDTGSFQFSCPVVSNSLRPHGLQHARLPCPSPAPRDCSNSCPLSRWCYPTISSSVDPFCNYECVIKKTLKYSNYLGTEKCTLLETRRYVTEYFWIPLVLSSEVRIFEVTVNFIRFF